MNTPVDGDAKYGSRDFGKGGGTVTWKLAPEEETDEINLTREQVTNLAESATNKWAKLIDIKFRQVGPDDAADIVIDFQDLGSEFFNAGEITRLQSGREIISSTITLNSNTEWKSGKQFKPGLLDLDESNLHAALLDTIGQAIGLPEVSDREAILSEGPDGPTELNLTDGKVGVAWYGPTKQVGTSGKELFVGDNSANVFKGKNGADEFFGFGGNDRLFAGAGDDIVFAGKGADVIRGRDGKDRIEAGAGNDLIDGGAGRDRLQGDAGKDKFLLSRTTDVDIILDFKQGKDKVQVQNGAKDFDDLTISAKKQDVRIVLTSGDKFIVKNAEVDEFSASDFLF